MFRVHSVQVYVGPGFVSMSPASKRSVCVVFGDSMCDLFEVFPGLALASAREGLGICHPPAGERGWAAEKTAVLGPPFGGQGYVPSI